MKVLSWMESEPVITRVGPAVLLVVGYLLTMGAIDQNTTDLVLGVFAALLGVGGVVGARSAVIPMAKLLGGEDSGGAHRSSAGD